MSSMISKAFSRTTLLLGLSLALVWAFAGIVNQYHDEIKEEFHERVDQARLKIPKIPTIKVDWHKITTTGHFVEDAEDLSPSPFNRSKLALLVEARPLPHLVPQILHMISVVPPDWKFLFVGSNQSVISVGRAWATKHQQKIGKLDLITLPEPWEIKNKESVYRLMTDIRFYDEFLPDVEWLLKYEHDSILCANAPISLNQWLSWDWTGAPRSKDDKFSGNGGLTMRRVSAIRRVLAIQNRLNNSEPEDEWYGKRVMVLPGAKVASAKHGQFAVEDTYMEQPMGYHVRQGGQVLNPAVWKNRKQRQEMFTYCPELSIIMDMKLERERCPEDDGEGQLVTPTSEPAKPTPTPAPEPEKPKAEEKPKTEAKPKAKENPNSKGPQVDEDGFQIQGTEDLAETEAELNEIFSENQNFDENNQPQDNGPMLDEDGFQIQAGSNDEEDDGNPLQRSEDYGGENEEYGEEDYDETDV